MDRLLLTILERHFDSDARKLADVQTSIYLIRK